MATLVQKQERTLSDMVQELWSGTNELFNEYLASISEQVALTPEQQEKLDTEYLHGTVEKRDRLAQFIVALDEAASQIREREKRMAARRQEFERVSGIFRSSILAAMQNNPAGIIKRVDGLESSFRVVKNPGKVEVFDESSLPGQFVKYTPSPEKAKIKDALDAGEEVPGARMAETTYRLEIK